MGCPDTDRTTAATATAAPVSFYPIGTPGKPWTDAERAQWKAGTRIQRSYQDEVVDKLQKLDRDAWEVVQYGALSVDPQRYPLFAVKSRHWQDDKPHLLVTGGVHGYETSGVQGAILFLQSHGARYARDANVVVVACVSPWGYEHIQRWNAQVQDPNRSFKRGSETEESAALMAHLAGLGVEWTCHVDLHETTDTDATEFMPAKHAEAGLPYAGEYIPDGFYLVGDSKNGRLGFQEAVVATVRGVTHIAPPDDKGCILDVPVSKDGIILVPAEELGLCASVTGGVYATTTEVYPDSPRASDEICNEVQVAAVTGALDYILSQRK